jgi:hypothetical protein
MFFIKVSLSGPIRSMFLQQRSPSDPLGIELDSLLERFRKYSWKCIIPFGGHLF